MDMISTNNYIRLCGVMAAAPAFSHASRNQSFLAFPLEVQRLSGNIDTLNVIVRPQQLAAVKITEQSKLCVTGQLRSFNNRHGDGAKLIISVFARELTLAEESDCNLVRLSGTLCKSPTLRTTPMGRDICDLMLAVNRHYGRSDYLPCICWGALAKKAALLDVGSRLQLEGRIQSRHYIKLTEEGPVEKTAYEVSVTELSALSPE